MQDYVKATFKIELELDRQLTIDEIQAMYRQLSAIVEEPQDHNGDDIDVTTHLASISCEQVDRPASASLI
jgi:hypothetical protein